MVGGPLVENFLLLVLEVLEEELLLKIQLVIPVMLVQQILEEEDLEEQIQVVVVIHIPAEQEEVELLY